MRGRPGIWSMWCGRKIFCRCRQYSWLPQWWGGYGMPMPYYHPYPYQCRRWY